MFPNLFPTFIHHQSSDLYWWKNYLEWSNSPTFCEYDSMITLMIHWSICPLIDTFLSIWWKSVNSAIWIRWMQEKIYLQNNKQRNIYWTPIEDVQTICNQFVSHLFLHLWNMHRPFLCSACLIQSLNALPMNLFQRRTTWRNCTRRSWALAVMCVVARRLSCGLS